MIRGWRAMGKIILTEEQRSQLDGMTSSEVHDQSGKVVGYFLTQEEYTNLVYAWAKEEFAKEDREDPFDDDEEGSMTTAEVLAYLESLDRESGAALTTSSSGNRALSAVLPGRT